MTYWVMRTDTNKREHGQWTEVRIMHPTEDKYDANETAKQFNEHEAEAVRKSGLHTGTIIPGTTNVSYWSVSDDDLQTLRNLGTRIVR